MLLLLWQPAATKTATHKNAPRDLRAYRANDECTTASNIVWGEGLRLRRIKTFEGPRAAKFHLRALSDRRAGNLLGYTVNIAASQEHFPGGDSHHLAAGKQAP